MTRETRTRCGMREEELVGESVGWGRERKVGEGQLQLFLFLLSLACAEGRRPSVTSSSPVPPL